MLGNQEHDDDDDDDDKHGDLYQLPSLKSCPNFEHLKRIHCPVDMASLLWHKFEWHEMTQIIREKDPNFVCLLNAIHVKAPYVDPAEEQIPQSHEIKVTEDYPLHPKEAKHCMLKPCI